MAEPRSGLAVAIPPKEGDIHWYDLPDDDAEESADPPEDEERPIGRATVRALPGTGKAGGRTVGRPRLGARLLRRFAAVALLLIAWEIPPRPRAVAEGVAV